MTVHLCPLCEDEKEVECENESMRAEHYGECSVHRRVLLVKDHQVIRVSSK